MKNLNLKLNTEPESVEYEAEEDDDPSDSAISELGELSLSTSDWTTETILSQIERGNINLTPKFQRRDAWKLDHKSRFIESLIVGFPVPQIVLAEQRDRRNTFIVLDGKQRLISLLKFAGKAGEGQEFNAFALSKLQVLPELNGITYDDLTNQAELRDSLNDLHNRTIRTVVIKNWRSEDLLNLIFVRLNTSSVTLSPQELRQALFPGDFVNFIDERAFESESLRKLMNLQHADFRMRDVEILLRYLAFDLRLEDYSGNMSQFLNSTAKELNQDFIAKEELITSRAEEFENAMSSGFAIFGEKEFARKWNGASYEKQWNRAVLDSMLFHFSDPAVREAAGKMPNEVIQAFHRLNEANPDYQAAITATTKSLTATYDRLQIWGRTISEVTGIPTKNLKQDKKTKRISIS